jgi:predicted  nucleic acid-binding Zn-ribbon protein
VEKEITVLHALSAGHDQTVARLKTQMSAANGEKSQTIHRSQSLRAEILELRQKFENADLSSISVREELTLCQRELDSERERAEAMMDENEAVLQPLQREHANLEQR